MNTATLTDFQGLNQSMVPESETKFTRDLDGVEVRRGRIISCRGITPLEVIEHSGGVG